MKAANLLAHSGLEYNVDVIERIAASLYACGQYEKAGEFFQRANLVDKAMDSYKKGHVFGAAVDLARISYPEQVIKLEEQWGDYLASSRQLDASINHFIESGNMIKAIDAAIGSKQVFWKLYNISGKRLYLLSNPFKILIQLNDIIFLLPITLVKWKTMQWLKSFTLRLKSRTKQSPCTQRHINGN